MFWRGRTLTFWIILALLTLLLFMAVSFGIMHALTLRFSPVQDEPIHNAGAQDLPIPGQKLKVLSWNVQYLAGKNHVFWYDMRGNQGPDTRPSASEIAMTLERVVSVIKSEDPDIVLLQEVDDGCGRSGGLDQLALLRERLPASYGNHTSAFYWKAWFVPHPRIMGPVGMKLSVLSKYPLISARRHALADVPRNALFQVFNIRRAILEVRVPVQGGGEFAVINTHLEAFVEGSDVMQRQVRQLDSLLKSLDREQIPWVAAGDLNLLPPGEYDRLQERERWLYNPNSEIELLYGNHAVLPTLKQATGPEQKKFWTHFPNRPWANGLDRVIDYMLYSPSMTMTGHHVLAEGNLDVSDHMPVVGEFVLPVYGR